MLRKEVTIYDIARRLQISSATVSRAFSHSSSVSKVTRENIFHLAEQLGYRSNHFARNLRTLRSNTIGVIIPKIDTTFATVVSEMERVAREENFHLIISQSFDDFQREALIAKNMFDIRVDGVIVSLAANTTDLRHFDNLLGKKVPILFFAAETSYNDSANVFIDSQNAACNATNHLFAAGCKKIVHVTTSTGGRFYTSLLNGYKSALQSNKVIVRDRYIIENSLTPEGGIEAAHAILRLDPRPDGIFFANDVCAVSCMMQLKTMGIRIPADIAVVGFGNDMVSALAEPGLTTINYPGKLAGGIAIRKLMDIIEEEDCFTAGLSIALDAELVIRKSSQRKQVS